MDGTHPDRFLHAVLHSLQFLASCPWILAAWTLPPPFGVLLCSWWRHFWLLFILVSIVTAEQTHIVVVRWVHDSGSLWLLPLCVLRAQPVTASSDLNPVQSISSIVAASCLRGYWTIFLQYFQHHAKLTWSIYTLPVNPSTSYRSVLIMEYHEHAEKIQGVENRDLWKYGMWKTEVRGNK